MKKQNVLVCGASFAGLSTAYWMHMLGYAITVVDIASAVKRGGTPVNIQERTIGITRRMGLLDTIRAKSLRMERMEFKNSEDETERSAWRTQGESAGESEEYEIERDDLLDMLLHAIEGNVTFVFGETVNRLEQAADHVAVTFRSGKTQSFDLVFGCDGVHSVVRKLCFGDEAHYSRFLGAYFAITIVGRSLVPNNTTQMYNEPGKAVMLNAYNGKTDIALCFTADEEIAYDYRNEQEQRGLIVKHFSGVGWRTGALLDEVARSPDFYFDKLCQTVMPSWSTGRVALVGDAAYCPSPAAGRGGSLAIDGAAALADAFLRFPDDVALAFAEYDRSFRPFVERVQAEVVDGGLDFFIPRTAEAIRDRNAGTGPLG